MIAGLALAPAVCAQPAPPPPGATTLAEAVRLSLAWQPDVRAQAANRRAADGAVAEARGAYLPSIDVSLGSGRERSNNSGTRFTDTTLGRKEAEVSLSQLLFDTGAVSSQCS